MQVYKTSLVNTDNQILVVIPEELIKECELTNELYIICDKGKLVVANNKEDLTCHPRENFSSKYNDIPSEVDRKLNKGFDISQISDEALYLSLMILFAIIGLPVAIFIYQLGQ